MSYVPTFPKGVNQGSCCCAQPAVGLLAWLRFSPFLLTDSLKDIDRIISCELMGPPAVDSVDFFFFSPFFFFWHLKNFHIDF